MKAFLLEDDNTIAQHIIQLLQDDGFETSLAQSISDARKFLTSAKFDLLVLDRMVPDGDSLELLSDLRQNNLLTPAIILTALGRSEDKTEGYNSGADDYLPKPFEANEFRARIKALIRRSNYSVQKDTLTIGALELHLKARTVFHQDTFIDISPKEFDLLKFFMENKNAIVTREMLLKEIWGLNFDPGTNVVDVNIGRLRKKILSGGDSVTITTKRGAGFQLEEKETP